MNRFLRFGSAALGMVLLAGLAFYQGNVDLSPGQQGMISGTALAEATESNDADCTSTVEQDDPDAPGCSQKKPAPEK